MAAKHPRLIIRLVMLTVLAGLSTLLAWRLLSPSTLTVVNDSNVELTKMELQFTVGDKPVEYKIDRLSPDEKQVVTLDLGSGDFQFVPVYRQGPVRVKCDPVSIKGRGEHVVLRIFPGKYSVVRE